MLSIANIYLRMEINDENILLENVKKITNSVWSEQAIQFLPWEISIPLETNMAKKEMRLWWAKMQKMVLTIGFRVSLNMMYIKQIMVKIVPKIVMAINQ